MIAKAIDLIFQICPRAANKGGAMDVLLLKPHSMVSNVLPPIGLGYLSKMLKKNAIETKIFHCVKDNIDILEIINYIKKEKVKIVGVTMCSNDHYWLLNFVKELGAMHDISLVVGGPHATGLGKRLMGLIPRIDFIIRTEGENAFPQLASYLLNQNVTESGLAAIPNLVWRCADGEVRENPIELPDDLDALGRPDWEQMHPREYSKFSPHGGFAKSFPVAQLITSRGCPYSCRYCASYVMNGKKIRLRSPDSIVDEIEYLIKDHGVTEIHIEDDNFTFYKDHVVNLCTAIRNKNIKINLGLPNGVRLDKLDEDILKELKSAGFYFFSVGIESGSPSILKKMNKVLNLETVLEKISLIKKYNFRVKGFFMLGYPGETKDDIIKTINYAKSLELDQAFFGVYIPLPGTVEFKKLEEEGTIDINKCNWQDYYTGRFSQPPHIPKGMTHEELNNFLSLAYKKFYYRPKIIIKMLNDITSLSQIKHLIQRGKSLIFPK